MGLFGSKKPANGGPRKGAKVCPRHGVYHPGTCTSQCVTQMRHSAGYAESDRAQEREQIDPNSGW